MKIPHPRFPLARIGLAASAAAVAAGFCVSALARPASAEDVLAKYEKTGEHVSCLPLRTVRNTTVLDDYAMLVEAGGDIYLNELNNRCAGLGRERRYSRESTTGQMCRGDIIRVLDSFGGFAGSCSLGAFEKLNEIPDDDAE